MGDRRPEGVRWAPRVRPDRIRRLYEFDARGVVDEDLIDAVGFALYDRCRSILHVTDALHGRVHCPRCETVILHSPGAEAIVCPACGWTTIWEAYHRTFRHQELNAGGIAEAIRGFMTGWERRPVPRERMVLIDRLLHAWHWETRRERPIGRPAGVNFIEGSRRQAIALLEGLTYGPANTPGLREQQHAWQATRRRVAAQPAGEAAQAPEG
jgi:ribosomal protein L37AE/L43A